MTLYSPLGDGIGISNYLDAVRHGAARMASIEELKKYGPTIELLKRWGKRLAEPAEEAARALEAMCLRRLEGQEDRTWAQVARRSGSDRSAHRASGASGKVKEELVPGRAAC